MLIRKLIFGLIAMAFIAIATTGAQEEVLKQKYEDRRDMTLLVRVKDNTFHHKAANTVFTIPKGWEEIPPHRLSRKLDPRTFTLLGISRADRDMVASLYWLPLPATARMSDYVRQTEVQGEFGEEYETLKAVYGRENVTTPLKMKVGPFEVYKINIQGGPDRGEKYNGTMYLFEVSSGEGKWMVKARISYPKADRNSNERFAEEVLQSYSLLVNEAPQPIEKKATETASEIEKK